MADEEAVDQRLMVAQQQRVHLLADVLSPERDRPVEDAEDEMAHQHREVRDPVPRERQDELEEGPAMGNQVDPVVGHGRPL